MCDRTGSTVFDVSLLRRFPFLPPVGAVEVDGESSRVRWS